jgi:hypothetical protein
VAASGPGAPLRCHSPCAFRREQDRQQRQHGGAATTAEAAAGAAGVTGETSTAGAAPAGAAAAVGEAGAAQELRAPLLSEGGGRPALGPRSLCGRAS